MKRDYLAYSLENFYNLGILDAITEGKSANKEIKEKSQKYKKNRKC